MTDLNKNKHHMKAEIYRENNEQQCNEDRSFFLLACFFIRAMIGGKTRFSGCAHRDGIFSPSKNTVRHSAGLVGHLDRQWGQGHDTQHGFPQCDGATNSIKLPHKQRLNCNYIERLIRCPSCLAKHCSSPPLPSTQTDMSFPRVMLEERWVRPLLNIKNKIHP